MGRERRCLAALLLSAALVHTPLHAETGRDAWLRYGSLEAALTGRGVALVHA